jgi:hypothetical protein
MALMTRSEIVLEGMRTAGRDDLGTLANTWLQNWLNAVAASWDWPILRRELSVTLNAQTMDYGNGTNGVSDRILRVIDELWWYTTDRSARGRIALRDQNAAPIDKIQASTVTGVPVSARSLKAGFGVARLSFSPTPDKAYNLWLPYQHLPTQMTSDSDVPWYENDETMIQAVAYKTHEYADGKDSPVTVAAQQTLAGLLSNDRYRYGNSAGQNDVAYKDPKVFPKSRR